MSYTALFEMSAWIFSESFKYPTPDFDENEESIGLIGTILGMVKQILKPLVSTIESLTRISTGVKRTGLKEQSATGCTGYKSAKDKSSSLTQSVLA